MSSLDDELAALKPTRDEKIMDLVAAAGVDVTPWALTKDGKPVKTPRSNPNYCYEWAFGGGHEPTVLCVWHRSIAKLNGQITLKDSVRQYALKLDPLTFDRSQPTEVRSRARDQARRARHFDSLLQMTYRKSQPVRIVLLEGEAKGRSELGWGTSEVGYRKLDPVPWYAHRYDDSDGSFDLVRGVLPATAAATTAVPVGAYIDQFSLPPQQDKVTATGTAYPRSNEVRRRALSRASGKCEFCGEKGFLMASGSIYLETHHVFPLSENGPDEDWNVVVLCPNDHRRAHFSAERDDVQSQLVKFLQATYPKAVLALDMLSSNKGK